MSLGSDIFGSKPTVPAWHDIDFGAEQGKAIANNEAAFPQAAELGNMAEEQILTMMRKVMPSFDGMRMQIGKNIESMLKGELPKDVSDAVQSKAAARSLGGGFAGSGMGRSLYARDLGLDSVELMLHGFKSAESWMTASERLVSPATSLMLGMFITPQQQAAFDANERDMKFAHDWLQNQVDAMPDPTTKGIFDVAMSSVSSMSSGMGGMGGGGGGGSSSMMSMAGGAGGGA